MWCGLRNVCSLSEPARGIDSVPLDNLFWILISVTICNPTHSNIGRSHFPFLSSWHFCSYLFSLISVNSVLKKKRGRVIIIYCDLYTADTHKPYLCKCFLSGNQCWYLRHQKMKIILDVAEILFSNGATVCSMSVCVRAHTPVWVYAYVYACMCAYACGWFVCVWVYICVCVLVIIVITFSCN